MTAMTPTGLILNPFRFDGHFCFINDLNEPSKV